MLERTAIDLRKRLALRREMRSGPLAARMEENAGYEAAWREELSERVMWRFRMTYKGRQWLSRIEARLAVAFAENFSLEGRSSWTEALIQGWRLVNILRTTGKVIDL